MRPDSGDDVFLCDFFHYERLSFWTLGTSTAAPRAAGALPSTRSARFAMPPGTSSGLFSSATFLFYSLSPFAFTLME
ncbi:hypothetical protein BV25DRAFT_1527273 [Artomyces pyxidatus]|uniref:Uncharacterized protein n=1 Tax=Artomyces pyxidatus TaxID=48021 RepID=A0ACB8TDA4_9AGAM|nr:hypothetical protein BV25DRAFT_1527273 [Artomyces pyxidatus]